MDDEADDAVGRTGPPLPPDDRLWRHPSELGSAPGAAPVRATAVVGRSSVWPVAVAAGLIGAALSGSLLAALGSFSSRDANLVVEKVAVTPVVSSPMLGGDRGVTALADRVSPTIVRVVVHGPADVHTASGVIMRTDGLVLTSAAEVADGRSLVVELHDGRRHDASVVGLDLPTDVAVLQIDAHDLPVAVMGSSATLEPGIPTVAFGCPHGTDAMPRLATGVVSALDRRVDAPGSVLHGMIQTDAPIEGAAAGGPLIDATGAVIGITASITGEAGFGYATPIDLVARVARQLIASGHAVHGWMGVEGADLPLAEAEAMRVDGGARVRQVAQGGPAELAGLASGDVITEVSGQPVASSSDLVVALRHHDPGDTVTVGYWRDGVPGATEVTLGTRTDP